MPVTATTLESGFTFRIQSGAFTSLADVSEALGGRNQGPSPHDYLEIALASCTAITLQMYAQRKAIPLEYADVSIRITAEGTTNEIQRDIKLLGDLTEAQCAALLAIAEKCPIHRLISAGARITSRLS